MTQFQTDLIRVLIAAGIHPSMNPETFITICNELTVDAYEVSILLYGHDNAYDELIVALGGESLKDFA